MSLDLNEIVNRRGWSGKFRLRYGDLRHWGRSIRAGAEVALFNADSNPYAKIMESRLVSVENLQAKPHSGLSKQPFVAWDAHHPQGKAGHSYFHINHQSMGQEVGTSGHADMPSQHIVPAKTLLVLKVGTKVLFVVGVMVDAYQLGGSAIDSFVYETEEPLVRQSLRTGGSWAGGAVAAKAGLAGGVALGLTATGVGVVAIAVIAVGAAMVGGALGYGFGDFIGDVIYR
jgi:hypothetical protein